MSSGEEEMGRQCYSSSVRKVVIAAILLLILEVNMIAIYTYTMVDNSDLTDTPRKDDIVVRVKRVDFNYLNSVTESTLGNILVSVKHTLKMDGGGGGGEDTGSGDGQYLEDHSSLSEKHRINERKHDKSRNHHGDKRKRPLVGQNHTQVHVLPSVYLLGAKTAGVELLSKLLAYHPQVLTTKSTRFFRDDSLFVKGVSWYRKSLPAMDPGKKLVEVDEELFSFLKAPSRLKQINPLARFIVILRDPLERTIADFLTVHRGIEGSGGQSYEAAFVLNDGKTVNEQSPIILESQYDVHLKSWLSAFNFSQFLFIDYFQMMTQPYAIMNKVERFCNMKYFFHKNSFKFNDKKVLCTRIRSTARLPPVCLTSDHLDLNFPTEIDEALKAYFTHRLDEFWSLVSNRLSVSDLVSLIN